MIGRSSTTMWIVAVYSLRGGNQNSLTVGLANFSEDLPQKLNSVIIFCGIFPVEDGISLKKYKSFPVLALAEFLC